MNNLQDGAFDKAKAQISCSLTCVSLQESPDFVALISWYMAEINVLPQAAIFYKFTESLAHSTSEKNKIKQNT